RCGNRQMVTRRMVVSPPSPSATATAASTPVSAGAVSVVKKCPTVKPPSAGAASGRPARQGCLWRGSPRASGVPVTVGSRAAGYRQVQRGLCRPAHRPPAAGAAAADRQGRRLGAGALRRRLIQAAELDVAAVPAGGVTRCLAGGEQGR